MNPEQNIDLVDNPFQSNSNSIFGRNKWRIVLISFLYLLLVSGLVFLLLNYSVKPRLEASKRYIKFASNYNESVGILIKDNQTSTRSGAIKASINGLQRGQKGWYLKGQRYLLDNQGLLALSQTRRLQSYVPSDMPISVDIIWIDGGKIVDLDRDPFPPYPNQPLESIRHYSPKIMLDKFILVKAGFLKDHGIKIGDQVEFSKEL